MKKKESNKERVEISKKCGTISIVINALTLCYVIFGCIRYHWLAGYAFFWFFGIATLKYWVLGLVALVLSIISIVKDENGISAFSLSLSIVIIIAEALMMIFIYS